MQVLLSSRFELRFVNTRDAAAARFGRDAQTRRDPGSFIHFAVINRSFFSLPPHNDICSFIRRRKHWQAHLSASLELHMHLESKTGAS